jgi:hypothetical protein
MEETRRTEVPYADPQKRREHDREYRSRPESKAYMASYRAEPEHKEKANAASAAYYDDFGSRRQQWFVSWVNLLKATQGCTDCGRHDGYLLYHHLDPATKLYNVSDMWGMSEEKFQDEVAKCTVLCGSSRATTARRKAKV